MTNRLEEAAMTLTPWIAALRQALADCGAWGHAMTGSGSACFGVMRTARQARDAARRLSALSFEALRIGSSPIGLSPLRATVLATATCPAASPPL
jgi:4-diphosphocytidyl-2C-methyl-D-erythritol kinase